MRNFVAGENNYIDRRTTGSRRTLAASTLSHYEYRSISDGTDKRKDEHETAALSLSAMEGKINCAIAHEEC